MNLMRFLRRPISLRQRLILTIGAILLVFELISVFWLWHESTEQIQLFEQALRDNRNNDRHIMREIREAVASLIVPGVFMVSLTLFICYQHALNSSQQYSFLIFVITQQSFIPSPAYARIKQRERSGVIRRRRVRVATYRPRNAHGTTPIQRQKPLVS